MLCAQLVMRKRDAPIEEMRPLPCRTWSCEYCGPRRRAELMAIAAAGEPTALLTLTMNANVGHGSGHRRDLLHDAWKKLVKRINRQFQLAPEKRWTLNSDRRSARQEAITRAITSKTTALEVRTLPYFAFLERTKRGEPHLHILIRSPFIPQDWLSAQMQDLTGSPVVWIEAIKGTRHAIRYVTKYVTKEPAQWGNKKRYWKSRNWKVKADDPETAYQRPTDPVIVERMSWRDHLQWRVGQGWTIEQTDEGWYQFHRPGTRPAYNVHDPWPEEEARKQGSAHSHPP